MSGKIKIWALVLSLVPLMVLSGCAVEALLETAAFDLGADVEEAALAGNQPASPAFQQSAAVEENQGSQKLLVQQEPERQQETAVSAAYEGYTLFAPLGATTTYLIDMQGEIVHTWESAYRPGNAVYLLENGHLMRTGTLQNISFNAGGAGGIVEEIDWDGNLIWSYRYADEAVWQHHDIEILPDGNILMIAWERKSAEEALAAGRNPDLLSAGEIWPDHVVEIEPIYPSGGEIVWEWHVWDHLIQDYDPSRENYGEISVHPERVDINYVINSGPERGGADWNHMNAVDYNAELDQVMLTVRSFSEFWIIDHSTSTAQAAGSSGGKSGMGGDLLYRWGNPAAYDAGSAVDQMLFVMHDAHWIEEGLPGAGNILIFNNGAGRPGGNYSTVDEIEPPLQPDGTYQIGLSGRYGPQDFTWSYAAKDPTDFYSSNISSAQRLPNGNTLICSGATGEVFEVTVDGQIVWEFSNTYGGSKPDGPSAETQSQDGVELAQSEGPIPGGRPPQGERPDGPLPGGGQRPNGSNQRPGGQMGGAQNANGGGMMFRALRFSYDYSGLQLLDTDPTSINSGLYSAAASENL